ncbi:hypothetical protein EYF80_017604 [Liparis tanakae]|uniref:Uncharacterized protein n=1 Tax=Liparis tanakae TaxID=230148 RepID=A0A4Z2I273_9TELE|nr:hypothetical protein EYF80_017604 [Liparis tanakae]
MSPSQLQGSPRLASLHAHLLSRQRLAYCEVYLNQRQIDLPKLVMPLPALSNSRKATMKRESGAHSTDSNATNS